MGLGGLQKQAHLVAVERLHEGVVLLEPKPEPLLVQAKGQGLDLLKEPRDFLKQVQTQHPHLPACRPRRAPRP